jgi:hypothetical protein
VPTHAEEGLAQGVRSLGASKGAWLPSSLGGELVAHGTRPGRAGWASAGPALSDLDALETAKHSEHQA